MNFFFGLTLTKLREVIADIFVFLDDCPDACMEIYSPVCGNDFKTYSNDCFLSIAACKSSGKLKKAYDGECKERSKYSQGM